MPSSGAPLATTASELKHRSNDQIEATVAHALIARGELERILYCWVGAGTQPSRRFLTLPPPRSMR